MSRRPLIYVMAAIFAGLLLAAPKEGHCSWFTDRLHDVTAPIGHAGSTLIKAVGQGLGTAAKAVGSGVSTAVGATISGVSTAGKSIGQVARDALHREIQDAKNLLADPNIANAKQLLMDGSPQFIQIVAGIKAAKASGIIKSNADCQTAAHAVSLGVLGYTGDPDVGSLTQEIGSAACNEAVPTPQQVQGGTPWIPPGAPSLSPGTPLPVPAPPGVPPIPYTGNLPIATGFGNFSYVVRPISICEIGSFPGHPLPHVFALMSDLTVANATPYGLMPFNRLFLNPYTTIGGVALLGFEPGSVPHYYAFMLDGTIMIVIPPYNFAGVVGRCG